MGSGRRERVLEVEMGLWKWRMGSGSRGEVVGVRRGLGSRKEVLEVDRVFRKGKEVRGEAKRK